MKFSICSMLIAAALSAMPVCAHEKIPPLENIYGGDPRPAACNRSKKRELEETVRQLAKDQSPAEAWQLVEHAMCGTSRAARLFVSQHMPKIIKSNSYDTGDQSETVELVSASLTFMPMGKAWDASAQDDGVTISINYWSSEPCVSGFKIAPHGKTWLLVEIGYACD